MSLRFMMRRLLVWSSISIALLEAGCSIMHPRIAATRGKPYVPLKGKGSVAEDGSFRYVVEQLVCERRVVETFCAQFRAVTNSPGSPTCVQKERKLRTEPVSCTSEPVPITITTPWSMTVTSPVDDSGTAMFAIDWHATGLDPSAAEFRQQLAQTWEIRSAEGKVVAWSPSERDIDAMAAAIMKTSLNGPVLGDAPPTSLAIKDFVVVGGILTAGVKNRLEFTLFNQGTAPALDVVATTRSSNERLHGLKFSFGRIDRGMMRQRGFDIVLPPEVGESSILVAVVAQAANADEVHIARRFPVRQAAPALKLASRIAGQPTTPRLNAGQRVTIECDVQNTGPGTARDVTITVELGTWHGQVEIKKPIASHGIDTARIPVVVPADAASPTLVFKIAATAAGMATPAVQELHARLVKSQRCKQMLTRAQYLEKQAKLRELLLGGAIDQGEYDRYDAALVLCIQ